MGAADHNNIISKTGEEIRTLLREAVDLILPYKCVICGKAADTEDRFEIYEKLHKDLYGEKSGLHICGKCLSDLNIRDEDRRWLLCLSNPFEGDPYPGLPLYMPFPYQGVIKKAVPRIKFGKNKELARLFGCILGSVLQKERVRADIIAPVPLSDERLNERGFNQASEIAYPVARMCNIPFAERCLVRVRDTKRQTELKDYALRASNVHGAFAVSDEWDVSGMTVVIIDDVATTGSTLHEAAEALYKAGASKVLCMAFAGNRQEKNGEPF